MHRYSQEKLSRAENQQPNRMSVKPHASQADRGLRTEACRLPASGVVITDRPDLSSLTLLQQQQMRRSDPGRDQQQRDHQRGLC